MIRLKPHEIQTLQMASEGLTSRQISLEMKLSSRTIENYFANCMRVLNAVSTTHAVAIALRKGIIK